MAAVRVKDVDLAKKLVRADDHAVVVLCKPKEENRNLAKTPQMK
jgi:hypothetical protein